MAHAKRRGVLTIPDLVLLSLLAERPMHGYQANLLLEQRQVRDWAGVSRPQVYYSLEKLLKTGLLREVEGGEATAGPERRVLATTAKGRAALAAALEREDWTTQRERPPFLTWLALSWQAAPGGGAAANRASQEISCIGTSARGSDFAGRFARSGPRASRGGVDAAVGDRAVQHRTRMARQNRIRIAAARAGAQPCLHSFREKLSLPGYARMPMADIMRPVPRCSRR